jgi:hypothetical protein
MNLEAGVLTAVWREDRILKPVKSAQSTQAFEATVRIERQGNRLTGTATSARWQTNNGAWTDLTGVTFEGMLEGKEITGVEIVWTRDASGSKTNWGAGKLTRQ